MAPKRKKPNLTIEIPKAENGFVGSPADGYEESEEKKTPLEEIKVKLEKLTISRKEHFGALCHVKSTILSQQLTEDQLENIELLGHGSSGDVWKARHIPSGTVLARKLVHVEAKPKVMDQILRELQVLHDCNSPEIISFFGSFVAHEEINILLEYMDGGALDAMLTKVDFVPEGLLAYITSKVLSGMIYLNDVLGIMHRDIKPSNILVNHKGDVKLCDFGVSGLLSDSIATAFVGTRSYMSPERLKGMPYTVKSDVWSLGLTLIELATGVFPIKQDSPSYEDAARLFRTPLNTQTSVSTMPYSSESDRELSFSTPPSSHPSSSYSSRHHTFSQEDLSLEPIENENLQHRHCSGVRHEARVTTHSPLSLSNQNATKKFSSDSLPPSEESLPEGLPYKSPLLSSHHPPSLRFSSFDESLLCDDAKTDDDAFLSHSRHQSSNSISSNSSSVFGRTTSLPASFTPVRERVLSTSAGNRPRGSQHDPMAIFELVATVLEGPQPMLPQDENFTTPFRDFIFRCTRKTCEERYSLTDLKGHPWLRLHSLVGPAHLADFVSQIDPLPDLSEGPTDSVLPGPSTDATPLVSSPVLSPSLSSKTLLPVISEHPDLNNDPHTRPTLEAPLLSDSSATAERIPSPSHCPPGHPPFSSVCIATKENVSKQCPLIEGLPLESSPLGTTTPPSKKEAWGKSLFLCEDPETTLCRDTPSHPMNQPPLSSDPLLSDKPLSEGHVLVLEDI